MGEIVLVPDSDGWLILTESREINILTVVDNVRTFVAIEICALRYLSPFEVEF